MSVLAMAFGLGVSAAPSRALAQPAPPIAGRDSPASRLSLDVGWDPTWLFALGYSHRLARPTAQSSLWLDAGFRAPLTRVPLVEAASFVGGFTFVATTRSGWGTAVACHTSVMTADDSTGTKLGFALATSLRPGWYAPRWSVALDLLAKTTIASYMHHSDAVRDLFTDRYPDGRATASGPRDGIYALAARRYRLGLAVAWAPSASVGLHAVGGMSHDRQLSGITANPPVGPLPFYVEAGGAYRW